MSIDREPGRLIDRRAVFLFASAVVSVLLVPLSPSDIRYVGVGLAVWCTLLGIGSWLDKLSRDRS